MGLGGAPGPRGQPGPAVVTPGGVAPRCQPSGVDEVGGYLVGVLDAAAARGQGDVVGGPDVLTYREMLQRVARIENRTLPIVSIPVLTPGLSSRWLTFVTDVDAATARNLIDSMSNEVIVRDERIRQVVPFAPAGYDQRVRQALAERAQKEYASVA